MAGSSLKFDWQSMGDWRLVLPPSRPSEQHLHFVSRLVDGVSRDASVAVLGSTIEYREVLARSAIKNVFIFDKNIEFLRFVSALSKLELTETIIEGDWLDTLPNFEGAFDLVLSHLTLGNIHFGHRRRFYSAISKILSDSGKFVDFVLTNEPGYFPINSIEERFVYEPVHIGTANRFSCQALFCSELTEKFQVVDTRRIYDDLYQMLGAKIAPLIDLAQAVTPIGGCWYYGRNWDSENTERMKWFDLVATSPELPCSAYAGRAEHQVLIRRGENDGVV